MARAVATVQSVVSTGITPSYTQATVDGTSFANVGGMIMVHIKNTNASPTNVTFQTPGKYKGETVTARVVAVPATSGDKMVGFFPPDVFNQADGTVYVDFSNYATGVVIGVFSIPAG